MDARDTELDRLLRAAGRDAAAAEIDLPFGFETRVVARWRAARREQSIGLSEVNRIFRRLAVVAIVVIAFSGAGAYWQLSYNEDIASPVANSFAIADSAIETGALQ